jgi:hypothetical protein
MARNVTVRPKTDVVDWAAIMEKDAEVATQMEASTGAGSFFSLRGGILTFNNTTMPDNQMAVVILDHIIENVYYDQPFDPDNISVPKCYAYGRDETTMAPHEDIVARGQEENETCTGCPMNQWGSAERGKGKACSNRRRLSVIGAGRFDGNRFHLADDEHFATSPVGLLKLPVMSVQDYSAYVNQIGHVMKRPPYGVLTLVKLVPDPRSQYKIACTLIDKLPDRLVPIIRKRREDTQTTLEQPYALDIEEEQAPPPPVKGKKQAARVKY